MSGAYSQQHRALSPSRQQLDNELTACFSRRRNDSLGALWKNTPQGAAAERVSPAAPRPAAPVPHDGRQAAGGVRLPRQRPLRERALHNRAAARPRAGELVMDTPRRALLPTAWAGFAGAGA